MKTDSSFKLSKSTKIILGTIKDKAQRSLYKNLMIQAELTQENNKKRKLVLGKNNED
jgi:hypothetical protein